MGLLVSGGACRGVKEGLLTSVYYSVEEGGGGSFGSKGESKETKEGGGGGEMQPTASSAQARAGQIFG
jgi:hypothetical protein